MSDNIPRHPLAQLIIDVWRGNWPEPDGGWTRVPPWHEGLFGVVAFGGHAAVAAPAEVSDERLDALGANGFGGAHDPRLMTALAGPSGWVDMLDCVLVGTGTGQGSELLLPRPDLASHDRVQRATWIRDNVRTFGLDSRQDVVITIADGLGGLPEVSVELAASVRRLGMSQSVLLGALDLVPRGAPLLASVSPDNVASLRAFLKAGYRPVGSVQLFRPDGHPGDPAIP